MVLGAATPSGRVQRPPLPLVADAHGDGERLTAPPNTTGWDPSAAPMPIMKPKKATKPPAGTRGGEVWLLPAVSAERGKQTWNQRFTKRMNELGFNRGRRLHACPITTMTLCVRAVSLKTYLTSAMVQV
jgi:hypothetical protein